MYTIVCISLLVNQLLLKDYMGTCINDQGSKCGARNVAVYKSHLQSGVNRT